MLSSIKTLSPFDTSSRSILMDLLLRIVLCHQAYDMSDTSALLGRSRDQKTSKESRAARMRATCGVARRAQDAATATLSRSLNHPTVTRPKSSSETEPRRADSRCV